MQVLLLSSSAVTAALLSLELASSFGAAVSAPKPAGSIVTRSFEGSPFLARRVSLKAEPSMKIARRSRRQWEELDKQTQEEQQPTLVNMSPPVPIDYNESGGSTSVRMQGKKNREAVGIWMSNQKYLTTEEQKRQNEKFSMKQHGGKIGISASSMLPDMTGPGPSRQEIMRNTSSRRKGQKMASEVDALLKDQELMEKQFEFQAKHKEEQRREEEKQTPEYKEKKAKKKAAQKARKEHDKLATQPQEQLEGQTEKQGGSIPSSPPEKTEQGREQGQGQGQERPPSRQETSPKEAAAGGAQGKPEQQPSSQRSEQQLILQHLQHLKMSEQTGPSQQEQQQQQRQQQQLPPRKQSEEWLDPRGSKKSMGKKKQIR